ncbi:MAG TPA: hypothetical protein VMG11_00775 [Steroidobacteraceae bacterium]|nr:hypothetical protein [Steroidobacteraceae bacterium]
MKAASPRPAPKRYWFPAKRYGWGWGPPSTWQGWMVIIVWFAILLAGMRSIGLRGHVLAHVAFVTVMTAVLIAVAYWKGEPPHWRWGDDT